MIYDIIEVVKNLYRRYRPLKLEDVVGQEQVTGVLSSSLKQGKVGHAYLFIGPRGCGKTSVARIFAHVVNGFKYELEDEYVDIIEIDGASNRGIDNIRELREKAAIAPTSGKYKVYIIDEVHMLTKEAFNALLKTLEEPPAHVIFIMATTDAYKVPVTITSRAQTYTFKLADAAVMSDFLRSVADKEGIKITDEALAAIAKRGGGSFRDSLSLLDQISTLSDNEITKELVISAMGLPEDEKIAGLLDEYIDGDITKITTALRELLVSGVKPETLAEEMIATIIDQPRAELLPLLSKLPEVKAPYAEAKLLVALCGRQLEYGFLGHGIAPARLYGRSAPSTSLASSGDPQKTYSQLPNAESAERPINQVEDILVTRANDTSANQQTAPTNLAAGSFDWAGYLERVQGMNEVLYRQLMKCEYELVGSDLHIYPKTKIIKNILASKNNKPILINMAENVKITIHEAGEHPKNAVKDETLRKISDIMGGEVINDGGDDPF